MPRNSNHNNTTSPDSRHMNIAGWYRLSYCLYTTRALMAPVVFAPTLYLNMGYISWSRHPLLLLCYHILSLILFKIFKISTGCLVTLWPLLSGFTAVTIWGSGFHWYQYSIYFKRGAIRSCAAVRPWPYFFFYLLVQAGCDTSWHNLIWVQNLYIWFSCSKLHTRLYSVA